MGNPCQSNFLPYVELMRLTKPQAALFCFWPAVWGCTMAAYSSRTPFGVYIISLVKCLIGGLVVRSSGCTINDILDRGYDKHVERCKNRPLPSGRVTVRAAWIFYFAQVVIGVLFFATFDHLAFLAGLIQLIPLSFLYPFMKRITYWPQAWLGVGINFSIIYSWLSTSAWVNTVTPGLVLSAAWCWTMVYETVYACQDMADDHKAGVKSTGVILADYILPITAFFALSFVILLTISGIANKQGAPYFVFSVGGVAVHMVWQLVSVDIGSPASCWRLFQRNSTHVGMLVSLGQFIDYVRILRQSASV